MSDVPPKKATTRKKLVDLKAVAALLEDNDGEMDELSNVEQLHKDGTNLQKPNEELIQTTSRIKNQRDLIVARLKKMENFARKVSKNVYEKVHRDYMIQLENITKILNEKKVHLRDELEKLYDQRVQLTDDVSRHKEILEEAQFRHFLEEFSEEQYKEVEEYESREITSLQNTLSQVCGFIRIHEDLFDPNELGGKVAGSSTAPVQPSKVAEEAASIINQDVMAKFSTEQKEITKTIAPEQKTQPETQSNLLQSDDVEDELLQQDDLEDISVHQDQDYFTHSEISHTKKENLEDNFAEVEEPSEPSISVSEPSVSISQKAKLDSSNENEPIQSSSENTGKTVIKKDAGVGALDDDVESIFDVLDDIPLESETAEAPNQVTAETSTPSLPAESSHSSHSVSESVSMPAASTKAPKLIFTAVEGDSDLKEFVLKENTSVGRSPSNDLVLKTPKVSRQHAAINKYKDQYIIIDLKSSNGLYVNGKKVDEHVLQDGDELSIAGYQMTFKQP